MKKLFCVLAAILFSAAVLTSCKSHERCPAYGKVSTGNQVGARG